VLPFLQTDSDGATPLHLAARRGSTTILQQLLAAGADLKAQNHAGETLSLKVSACLLSLVRCGQWSMCTLLLLRIRGAFMRGCRKCCQQ
jgi:hypothetical protein